MSTKDFPHDSPYDEIPIDPYRDGLDKRVDEAFKYCKGSFAQDLQDIFYHKIMKSQYYAEYAKEVSVESAIIKMLIEDL